MTNVARFTALALLTRLVLACGAPEESHAPMSPSSSETDIHIVPDALGDALVAQDPGGSLGELNFGQSVQAVSSGAIRALGDGGKLCLSVDKGLQSGTPVRLGACDGSDEHSFRLDGKAIKVMANRCVRPGHALSNNGATLRVYACNADRTSQTWRLDGQLLRWASSDKCLDVVDGVFSEGTQLQLWTCDAANEHQHFGLSSAGAPAPAAASTAAVHGQRLQLSRWHQETYHKGMFNNEEQRYTDGNRNVTFGADGTTTIRAYKVNGEWTSARLTGDPIGALPVYMEADISLPSGKGTWPAFWLTSRGAWPQGGEIDIMEQVNGDGKTHWSNHWGPHSGQPTFNTHEDVGGLDLSKSHRYGGYVTAKGVQFYLDGKPVGKWVTYPAESNFPKIASEMVPIVNLAMGGNWPGQIPGSTGPQTMVVHSVTKASGPPRL